jgi:hypothetical protein
VLWRDELGAGVGADAVVWHAARSMPSATVLISRLTAGAV